MVRVRVVGVLVALTCAALVGCTGTDGDTPKASVKPTLRTADWSISRSDRYGPIVTAQVVASHVVVVFERRVAVLDRKTGAERWSVGAEFPNNLQAAEDSVRVTADALVLLREPSRREDPGTATVYDLATGDRRVKLAYQSTGTAQVAVTADTLLVRTVRPASGERPDRFRLQSVDLRTGRRLWREQHARWFPAIQPPVHNSDPLFVPRPRDPLLAPESTLVVLRGRLKPGGDFRTWVVDPRNGRTVGATTTPPDDTLVRLLDDHRYVVWDDDSDGCGTRVTGYDVASSKPVWRLRAAAWRNVTKPECTDLWRPVIVGGKLLTHTSDERPMLVDPDDGKPTWTGPEGLYPIGVAGDVVVGRASRENNAVVAYDTRDSRRLWRADDPGPIQAESDTVVPGYAILSAGLDEVWTYRIKSGKKRRCEGDNRVIAAGDGWLLAGLKGDSLDDGKLALRYFAL